MTESIWIHYARPRPHWYALPEAERVSRRAAWGDIAAQSAKAGGKRTGPYHIRGQHDFETVEVWTAVGPAATSWLPNASDSGLAASSVLMPVPESAIVSSGALDAMVTVAAATPTADGSNRTRTAQLSVGASVVPTAQSPA